MTIAARMTEHLVLCVNNNNWWEHMLDCFNMKCYRLCDIGGPIRIVGSVC